MLVGTFAAAPIRWDWVERAIEFCRVEGEAESVEQWCLLLEPKAIARGRRRLVELSLLERSGEQQYQVHPLLREFFAGKLVGDEQRAIQTAVASVMIEIAKEIPQAVTQEIARSVTLAIPHMQAVAEVARTL
jgi:hypothetical protein